jgi:tetratricopeptide (TPR) repeat protein
MKRLAVIGAFGLVALAVVVVIGIRARVHADDPRVPPPVVPVAGTYDPTAEATDAERVVLGELDTQKWIAAREHAEKILRDHPDSFVATWAMANVHHYEEGNHARALYFVRRAEQLLVAKRPLPSWHREVLIEQNYILGEMDRIGEQLALLDRLHALYPPGRDELRIWPLIKLRRYDDARAAAQSMLGSEDANERTHAHNGLMAVESEAHLRGRAYEVAMAAVAARPDNCIINRNAGAIAWERFRPQQAEDLLLAATTAEINDCASSPYVDLAWIYLMGGEFQQTVAALKQANAVPLAKQYRPHHMIERRAMLADLVHALGKPEEAERLATEVYEQPERTGMVSASEAMARLTRTIRYWLALDARVIYERERASYRSFYSNATTRARLVAARWEVRRALFQLSADTEALITITRPNIGDTHVARWTTGGLIEILGPGVMKTAVAEARRRDAEFPEATPYFDALSGEIAYRTGELAEAVKLADSALAGIPSQDGLIRWYVMAWKADADWRLGNKDAAIAGYHDVLQKLPGALRILDVALPVTVKHDGSGLASEIADGLTESSRFTSSGGSGFQIDVSANGNESTICLTDARGFQFACDTSTKGAEAALDAFHLAAFSPKIAVTQADLSGLDGSATSRTADQVLEGLLK